MALFSQTGATPSTITLQIADLQYSAYQYDYFKVVLYLEGSVYRNYTWTDSGSEESTTYVATGLPEYTGFYAMAYAVYKGTEYFINWESVGTTAEYPPPDVPYIVVPPTEVQQNLFRTTVANLNEPLGNILYFRIDLYKWKWVSGATWKWQKVATKYDYPLESNTSYIWDGLYFTGLDSNDHYYVEGYFKLRRFATAEGEFYLETSDVIHTLPKYPPIPPNITNLRIEYGLQSNPGEIPVEGDGTVMLRWDDNAWYYDTIFRLVGDPWEDIADHTEPVEGGQEDVYFGDYHSTVNNNNHSLQPWKRQTEGYTSLADNLYGYDIEFMVRGRNRTEPLSDPYKFSREQKVGAWSSILSFTSPPQTPDIVLVSQNNSSFTVKATLTQGKYSKIRVYRYNGSTLIDYIDADNGQYVVFNAQGSFTFKARTYINGLGGVIWSNYYSEDIEASNGIESPTGPPQFDISYGGDGRIEGGIYLKIASVVGATSYKIKVRRGYDNEPVYVTTTATSGILVSGLQYGVRYYVSYCAITNGVESVYSSENQATTQPKKPSVVISRSTVEEIDVLISVSEGNWDEVLVRQEVLQGTSYWQPIGEFKLIYPNTVATFTSTPGYQFRFWSQAIKKEGSTNIYSDISNYVGVIGSTTTRPDDFIWTTPKESNTPMNLTWQEWNDFIARINGFRQYKSKPLYEVLNWNQSNQYKANDKFQKGTSSSVFYAYQFNQAVKAIQDMTPPTSTPSLKVGISDTNNSSLVDDVTASDLNEIVASLNSIL